MSALHLAIIAIISRAIHTSNKHVNVKYTHTHTHTHSRKNTHTQKHTPVPPLTQWIGSLYFIIGSFVSFSTIVTFCVSVFQPRRTPTALTMRPPPGTRPRSTPTAAVTSVWRISSRPNSADVKSKLQNKVCLTSQAHRLLKDYWFPPFVNIDITTWMIDE